MRLTLLTLLLVCGVPKAPAAALQGNGGPWLVWWAEAQKAARQNGKPIFLVFR